MMTVLRSRLFEIAQQLDIDDSILLYQDNISAICMETNSKASCITTSKYTKHMKIRYFYITNKVKSGEIIIEYCPTSKEMIEDYSTRPLARALFKKLRDMVLEINDGDTPKY